MDVAVMGKRVLVKKEQIDLGGLKGTPGMEEGQKNIGTIVEVGQIGELAKSRGIKKGAKIVFHKHFAPNYDGGNDNLVFVDLENILGVFRK